MKLRLIAATLAVMALGTTSIMAEDLKVRLKHLWRL